MALITGTRVYGSQLSLEIDGDDYAPDITNCVKKAEPDGDRTITFGDATAGEVHKHYLEITAVQSTDADSWWSFCNDNVGQQFAFQHAQHANATPTANQPHITGTLEITAPPELGVEAGRKKTGVFTMRCDIIGEPVVDRGA